MEQSARVSGCDSSRGTCAEGSPRSKGDIVASEKIGISGGVRRPSANFQSADRAEICMFDVESVLKIQHTRILSSVVGGKSDQQIWKIADA